MKLVKLLSIFAFSMGLFSVFSSIYTKQSIIGKQAPVFKAKAVFPDGTVREVDLKNYIGKKIVLYFYPMDNTPGCTKQAQIFRDAIADLQAKDIILLGISCDSIKSHQKFQKEHNLPFPLISDSRWHKTISKAYGAAGWFYSQRKTFLINEEGTVIKSFEKVSLHDQINDILVGFGYEPKDFDCGCDT